jgi:hypothetical protein
MQALLRRRLAALRLLAAVIVISWSIALLEPAPADAQEAAAVLGPWQATETLGTVEVRRATTAT